MFEHTVGHVALRVVSLSCFRAIHVDFERPGSRMPVVSARRRYLERRRISRSISRPRLRDRLQRRCRRSECRRALGSPKFTTCVTISEGQEVERVSPRNSPRQRLCAVAERNQLWGDALLSGTPDIGVACPYRAGRAVHVVERAVGQANVVQNVVQSRAREFRAGWYASTRSHNLAVSSMRVPLRARTWRMN